MPTDTSDTTARTAIATINGKNCDIQLVALLVKLVCCIVLVVVAALVFNAVVAIVVDCCWLELVDAITYE